ncbi:alpha-galactosidase [Saccharospirillum impatiens]|uniref:alpha-galactosidase n=1 Tax=Saccharospirillum impatiens TaxID=169438 RepID=UPI00041C4725|nr:alpha-galactosidase [Saccharospirillum impatiens]
MTVYALHSHSSTLLIEALPDAAPAVRYWGSRLQQSPDPILWEPALPQAGLDEIRPLSIAPTLADGTFLEPALRSHQNGQGWAEQWQLAATQATDTDLVFELVSLSGLIRLHWHVTLDAATDVLAINTQVTNLSEAELSLEQWLTTLPLPREHTDVLTFTGRWVNEFQPRRQSLPIGALELTNLKGRTSHDHFPGLLTGTAGFGANHGDVCAFHLGWSGNHRQRVERNQQGLTQFQAGAHLLPGEVRLAPGAHFTAPVLYATRSSAGFNGIARNFQQFVRQNLMTWPNEGPRPVHINTWEAIYFDHTQEALDNLAEAAAAVGAERYVLDDGWFQGRRDDSAGLGDWTVDESLYPEKLHPLAATLKRTGLEFGLWVEPEMVNPDSNLYRQHPDWVLAIAGQHQPLARQQRILDLTREDVQTYLFDHLNALLNEYPIRYLKWDMNRDLVQAADARGLAATFRQTKALYALLAKLREAHPRVEIESCASGGARMDYGILKHTHRFWLSDCNDAHERQRMQQWAALFFPAEVLGSHIGPAHSHTTGRQHTTTVRAGTALFGHMGIEWDVRQLNDNDRQALTDAIAMHKTWRAVIHGGIRQSLEPVDPNQIAFQVSAEPHHLISVFQQDMPELSVPGSLKIPGLKLGTHYSVSVLLQSEKTGHLMKVVPAWMTRENVQLTGESLATLGLPLPVMDPDSLLVLALTEG